MAIRTGRRGRDAAVAGSPAASVRVTAVPVRPTLAELIGQVVLEAAGEEELGDILAAALERLRGLVPFTGGSIALIDGDELVVRAAVGPFAREAMEQRLPRNGSASWKVLTSRRAQRIDDLAATGLRTHAGRDGRTIRSWIAAPLVRKGRAIGLLEVDSTEPGAFDDEHLRILQAVATALSGPVEIANRYEVESRALEESEAAQTRLAFIADAGEILASSLDYEATLASIARLAVPGIADWCSVDVLDADGRPRLVALSHVDPDLATWAASLRDEYPVDMSADTGLGKVLRTGESVLVPEITREMLRAAMERDPRLEQILRKLGPLHSSMTVAMREGDRVSGAISFISTRSGRHYGADDLRLAEELARRAGVAIASARLFREASEARLGAEQTATRNAQLLGITAELSTAITVQDVARAVVERTVTALWAHYGWLAILTPDGAALEVAAEKGLGTRVVEQWGRVPLEAETPLSIAARTGKPQWLSPLEGAADEYPDIREGIQQALHDGRRALAAVPVRLRDRTIGALALGFDEPRDFEGVDGEFLTALAQLAAQALDRASLFESERDARQRAETAQASLRARERQQAAIAALGQQAIGATNLDELFKSAVDAVARQLDSEMVELLELMPEARRMRLVGGTGWRKGLVGNAKVDAGAGSQAGYTLLSGGPVIVEDLARETRFKPSRLLVEHGAVAGLTVPIGRFPDTVWGVLGAFTTRPRTLTSDDVNFVQSLSNVLHAAIVRARAEEERDRLMEVEREAQRRRQAFIGVMSHELRTPITTIYAGAKFLARGGRGAARRQAQEEVLEDIQHESERLYRLVEDLLVITRVERGRVEPAGEPLLLQRLLPRQAAAEQAATRDLRVEIDVPENLPTVRGEETYVEQVVRNFLSNARKYSPAGGTVRLVADATDEEVRVRVLDEGPGFPPEEAEHLFELFYRSPTTAEHASGAGIGLFVCSQLIDAMGGRVWARPRPEGGAEFGFALPRVSEDEMA
jgi:signal transduction histidine kinase/putative methionine-R-sulfoxide reductase with GAF domain